METRSARGGRTPHFAAFTAETTVCFQGMARTRVGVNVSARSLRDARPALRAGFGGEKTLVYRKTSVGVGQMSEKTRGAVCVPASQSKRWSLLSLLSTWSMSSQVARFVGGMRLRLKARSSLCQSGAMPVPDNVLDGTQEKNHQKRAISQANSLTGKRTRDLNADLAVSRSRISKRKKIDRSLARCETPTPEKSGRGRARARLLAWLLKVHVSLLPTGSPRAPARLPPPRTPRGWSSPRRAS